MKGKNFFKTILLTILLLISYFYIYVTVFNVPNTIINHEVSISIFADFLSLMIVFLPITIGINIVTFHKKKKLISILLLVFNSIPSIGILHHTIKEYILFQSFNSFYLYIFYLIIITIIFIYNIINKNNNHPFYDNLLIILTIIIIMLFYRYYLDPHFIHNRYIGYAQSGTTIHETYIYQYLLCIIVSYTIILIGNKIENLK